MIEEIAQLAHTTPTSITNFTHIEDAEFDPVVPESIMAYSIVNRGKRHTYARMARSINR